METKMTLGNKIQYFRKKRGISQLQLELLIQASPGSISRIESGKTNPTKETLFSIARVLNLTPYEKAELFEIELVEEDFMDMIVEKVIERIQFKN